MDQAKNDFVVVANRLPAEFSVDENGAFTWQTSPGGLVTALEPIMRAADGAWVGWTGTPGFCPEPFDAEGILLVPVHLSEEDIQLYYEGFSNGTLWPLYHDVIAPPEFHREWWDAFVEVNERFATQVSQVTAIGGTVWIHDYQLQLVPQFLRTMRPDIKIGYFHHIPFPPQEIFAQLPWRARILQGLLGADLIGFQRASDASNFRRAVRRFTGLTTKGNRIQLANSGEHSYDTRIVYARHFPISIDSHGLDEIARRPDVQKRAQEIRHELGDPEVMFLGVDRLDYTKGIRHRLKAFGELLHEGRMSVPQAVLVQVASPSREQVDTYINLRDEVESTVGRINGDFAELGTPAIQYFHHAYPRDEMVAMFLAADVMLVTALRDGMNLVAKEYIAARHDNGGVLILSEFTGAADELTQAVLINPHDIDGLKNAMLQASTMNRAEATRRMRFLRRKVLDNDVDRWARSFIEALNESVADNERAKQEAERTQQQFATAE